MIVASRKLLAVRDSYGIQIAPDFETPLALAIVVALEQMELEERQGRGAGPRLFLAVRQHPTGAAQTAPGHAPYHALVAESCCPARATGGRVHGRAT